jgi:hypothetical protein
MRQLTQFTSSSYEPPGEYLALTIVKLLTHSMSIFTIIALFAVLQWERKIEIHLRGLEFPKSEE